MEIEALKALTPLAEDLQSKDPTRVLAALDSLLTDTESVNPNVYASVIVTVLFLFRQIGCSSKRS